MNKIVSTKNIPMPARYVDQLIPQHNVMAALLAAKKIEDHMLVPHDCRECLHPIPNKDGCPNCVHEWTMLPSCGDECQRCKARTP